MATGLEVIWYIRVVEGLSLVIALVLVALAFGGYRKSRSKGMLFAALGFAMLGIASLVEGILYEGLGLPLESAHAFRSTLTALGLIILLYSVQKAN
jgi:uncharacterized membrane protein